jgi:LysM domain
MERTHLVHAGETPERIASRYGVSWASIVAHPANGYLRKRTHYPLHPGDKLVVPASLAAPDGSLGKLARELERVLMRNLIVLHGYERRHPSAGDAKVHSIAPPDVRAAASPAASGKARHHQDALPGVKPGVKLTASIEAAYLVLRPLLPGSVWMTSGYRSDADQAALIDRMFKQRAGPSSVVDTEARRQWLLALKLVDKTGKPCPLRIGKVGDSPHRTGLAFDLSGADLDLTNAVVHRCATLNPSTFPLKGTIVEKGQNCVHVNLRY